MSSPDRSLEDTVDNLWNAILNLYFPQREFIITQNARPEEGTKLKVDFIVQNVLGAEETQHVVLIEDKRASKEEGQDAAWVRAVEQLTDYMTRAKKGDKGKFDAALTYHMYGIVNVGRYSRFYVLQPTAKALEDLPGTQGKAYHVKNDELQIVAILKDIVNKTIPFGLSSSSSSSSAQSSRHASPAPASRPGSSGGVMRSASPAVTGGQRRTASPATGAGKRSSSTASNRTQSH
ncbi:hypothetical protein C7999DRAFT_32973 [Corynascus novoguineensis]|uniref:Uncharacterized protein n=1 Tax=Corynascus novoguineensis TaxID=1126955 RepID=A0AAN7CQV7_9PEZI|nr:hypothetical protein C7999DRAFT_32973 [Corynascus novoguineensis]